jgi:hypothetical protein
MFRTAFTLLLVVGVLSVSRAPGADTAEEDAKKLQGSWKGVEMEESGEKVAAEDAR